MGEQADHWRNVCVEAHYLMSPSQGEHPDPAAAWRVLDRALGAPLDLDDDLAAADEALAAGETVSHADVFAGLSRESTRASELEATHTAAELARIVAQAEADRERLRAIIDARTRALVDISTGHWTAEGARDVARKALHDG
jgi:hypothetical protein